MKVFVAGAGGAIGSELIPRLAESGHDVFGMTRTERGARSARELGAHVVVADALDRAQVVGAVAESEPDAIVHELTALSGSIDLRHFERSFEPTNRLRTEATDHLLAAGRAIGVGRFVAQSFAGWPYAREGDAVKTERDPLDTDPPAPMRSSLAAIRHLEDAVLGADWTTGIVLRYGGFYGPHTSLASGGEHIDLIRRRRFPLIGDGRGVWSFVHIADAADATVAALERGGRGIYNVVDDEPAAVGEWLPTVAEQLGAKPPVRLPKFAGRVLGGEAAVVMMTDVRGASNEKAKRELGWRPRHPSWRQGIAAAA